MSKLIQKAHEMLLDAETPDDYLDAARALNMGTLLTMRLANDEKVRTRLEAILDELADIRKQIVLNTIQDKNIDSTSGGGVPRKDDVTKQIWPANLDD